jgi:hypothetical protein
LSLSNIASVGHAATRENTITTLKTARNGNEPKMTLFRITVDDAIPRKNNP